MRKLIKKRNSNKGETFKKFYLRILKQGIIRTCRETSNYINLDNLDEKAMINILTKPKNAIVKQYKKLCKLEGVDLEFTEEAD